MTTTWTTAALAYEAHLAELETARKQYDQAVDEALTQPWTTATSMSSAKTE